MMTHTHALQKQAEAVSACWIWHVAACTSDFIRTLFQGVHCGRCLSPLQTDYETPSTCGSASTSSSRWLCGCLYFKVTAACTCPVCLRFKLWHMVARWCLQLKLAMWCAWLARVSPSSTRWHVVDLCCLHFKVTVSCA